MTPGPAADDSAHVVALWRLQSTYADIVTRRAWDELETVFRPDIEIHLDTVTAPPRTFVGSGAFAAFVGPAMERFDHFTFVILNTVVEITELPASAAAVGEARGRLFMCEIRHDRVSDTWQNAHGLYQDRYVHDAGRWWIAERHYRSLARTGPEGAVLGSLPASDHSGASAVEPELVEIDDGTTVWRFDAAFLQSNWTCIWGRGCLGIHDEPTPHLSQGCCSVGAELDDGDEAMTIGALAAVLEPARFEHHAEAAAGGIYADERRRATRVVDGACIFLNRVGFEGGEGCALHLAALDAGEPPTDWKPSVCWQLPIKVDWASAGPERESATLRAWSRADWGAEGRTMAWCCTEDPLAYVGDAPVIDTLASELEAIVGPDVYVELRRRFAGPSGADADADDESP